MSDTANFVEQCLAGEADLEDIERFVELWHQREGDESLHDFLGLTWDEYRLWVEKPSALPFILASRKYSRPLADMLGEAQQSFAAAARAGSPDEARQVLDWLHRTQRA